MLKSVGWELLVLDMAELMLRGEGTLLPPWVGEMRVLGERREHRLGRGEGILMVVGSISPAVLLMLPAALMVGAAEKPLDDDGARMVLVVLKPAGAWLLSCWKAAAAALEAAAAGTVLVNTMVVAPLLCTVEKMGAAPSSVLGVGGGSWAALAGNSEKYNTKIKICRQLCKKQCEIKQ